MKKTVNHKQKTMETQQKTTPSLFERIGGMDAVNAAVDIFYAKVRADERVRYFFNGIDMEKQAYKLKGFIAYAFGAKMAYTGKSMRNAHAHLVEDGLNEGHFNIVMQHLAATLQDLGVPEELILEAGAIAESTRHDVLGYE